MTDAFLSPWQLWLIVAAVLITAEIFVPGFVLAGLAFAALCASATHYLFADLGAALLGFIGASVLFFIAIRPIAVRSFMSETPSPFGVQAMIGQQVLVEDSPQMGGSLQAHFKDSMWSLQSADELTEGDRAEIIGVHSNTLIVKRVPL